MTTPGLIVVGSGPAGVSAAAEFRERNDELPVLIVTADADLPYARPPLSKEYLRGETDDVGLHDARWFADRRIEILHSRVEGIDPVARSVAVGTGKVPYRALVLACGSGPTPLQLPGGHIPLQLRSLADAARLREAVGQSASAVVIGAGFIGCEAAASLAARGVSTTIVAPDPVPQVKRLGAEAGHRMRGMLQDAGVRYVGGATVKEIETGRVTLDDGVTIDTDLILAATGTSPRGGLAEEAGLAMKEGRIVVDAGMRTSVEDVYAAGDVAFAFNAGAGRHVVVEHWQDADDHGVVAGANAAGGAAQWDAVPGFWTAIGDATLKYHAWGDGFERSRLVERGDGFTIWYESNGAAVAVLTYDCDEDYDLGERLIAEGKPVPIRIA